MSALYLAVVIAVIVAAIIGIVTNPDRDQKCEPGPDCESCPFPCEHHK